MEPADHRGALPAKAPIFIVSRKIPDSAGRDAEVLVATRQEEETAIGEL